MIEKDKSYTYKELDNMFDDAIAKTMEKLSKMFVQASAEHGEQVDSLSSFMFNTTNMVAMVELRKTIFGKEE